MGETGPSIVELDRYAADEFEYIRRMEKNIRGRTKQAEEIAKAHSVGGDIIGYVSRLLPSSVSFGDFVVSFEMPADRYFDEPVGIGDYIALSLIHI